MKPSPAKPSIPLTIAVSKQFPSRMYEAFKANPSLGETFDTFFKLCANDPLKFD